MRVLDFRVLRPACDQNTNQRGGLTMFRFAASAALCVGALAMPVCAALADLYPSKPVKFIIPQAPGAQNDVLGRLLAERLTELWKEAVVVENHGGVGGTLGADLAAKAPADDYTVMVGGSTTSPSRRRW
jgi:tripartite-type tricarboxylate transporter receptor subunit TctC